MKTVKSTLLITEYSTAHYNSIAQATVQIGDHCSSSALLDPGTGPLLVWESFRHMADIHSQLAFCVENTRGHGAL